MRSRSIPPNYLGSPARKRRRESREYREYEDAGEHDEDDERVSYGTKRKSAKTWPQNRKEIRKGRMILYLELEEY